MHQIKVILIHGNSGSSPNDIWFPYVKKGLEEAGIETKAPQFPDADLARASYWLPFLKNDLQADEKTILVGHSSGAIAALRFAENHKLFGTVLVGAYYTDLGLEKEKLSGYFDTPWDWEKIKNNQNWIIQFASSDDPWIPIAEPRFVRDQLHTIYHEYHDQGHFGGDYNKTTFPEMLTALNAKIQESRDDRICK